MGLQKSDPKEKIGCLMVLCAVIVPMVVGELSGSRIVYNGLKVVGLLVFWAGMILALIGAWSRKKKGE